MSDSTRLAVERFSFKFDPLSITRLFRRLEDHQAIDSNDETWYRGTPSSWLDQLVADWKDFDVPALERSISEFEHFQVQVDLTSIHVIVELGSGASPIPIILTHGWPGSFMEYLKLMPMLAHPENFGGDPDESFTVVVPSLPGFGFSGPLREGGFTYGEVAELWNEIMVNGLGFDSYVAHGSDLGAGITARLARAHPLQVAAIHLATPGMPIPPKPWSPRTTEHFREVEVWTSEEGGYMHVQSTKPSTIGAALADSPIGLASWIGEKAMAWSDTDENGNSTFDRELLLSTLTLYWATRTAASSLLPYWRYRHTPNGALIADDVGPTPVAVSIFGGEKVPFPKPPRDLVARYFNLSSWTEYDTGGHFPAVSDPSLLAKSLRQAFRQFRTGE